MPGRKQVERARRLSFVAAAALALAAVVAQIAVAADGRVDADVTAALAKGQPPDVIVKFAGRADLAPAFALDRRQRGRFVYQIAHVQAPQAWALGYDGAGVVIGNIDTGVRHTQGAGRAVPLGQRLGGRRRADPQRPAVPAAGRRPRVR